MHDDQHGTATVALAALLNACASSASTSSTRASGRSASAPRAAPSPALMLRYGAREVLG
jgi:hypothetical protein